MSDNCHELASIKYKTMLLQGELTPATETILNIEEILEKESVLNKLEPWCKLDKTLKMNKLSIYADLLTTKFNLVDNEKLELIKFLSNCLERKNFNKVKDVIYDRDNGIIKNIPNLQFNNITRKFNLKKSEKHVSTIKSLSVKKISKSLDKDLEKLEITDKIDI